MKAWKKYVAAAVAALMTGTAAAEKIQVWHALDSVHKTIFESFVAQFNKQQAEVQVELSSAPSFDAMRTGVQQAVRDKRPPHLVQLPDYYAPEVVVKDHRVMPLYELLAKHPIKDVKWFLPQTTQFVRDSRGRLLALPLMAEVPVLFYNRDAYKKAGLNPDAPPATWSDLQAHLIQLQAAGQQCPYATSNMVWVHQENLAAMNNQPFASRNNGLDSGRAELLINQMLHVRHMSLMTSWVRSQLLTQASFDDESDVFFAEGRCAVLSSGSGAWAHLEKGKFSTGVAPLPHYTENGKSAGAPLVGGSSLWALSGHSAGANKAVAQFIAWLASPTVAAQWHQRTGYLPLTDAAARAADVSFYRSIPGAQQVVERMQQAPGPNSRGIRLPKYHAVQAILNEETAAALNGKKPPMKAQADAVQRSAAAMSGK